MLVRMKFFACFRLPIYATKVIRSFARGKHIIFILLTQFISLFTHANATTCCQGQLTAPSFWGRMMIHL
jgi:hypothetical protein